MNKNNERWTTMHRMKKTSERGEEETRSMEVAIDEVTK